MSNVSPSTHLLALVPSVAAAVALALLAGCTSAADVRAHQEAQWQELQLEADRLFEALAQAAAEHEIPIATQDADRRRLTSQWIFGLEAARPEVRRRYYLAVLAHPRAGLALHARIARQAPVGDGVDAPIFQDMTRTQAVIDEENEIVRRAYEIYRSE